VSTRWGPSTFTPTLTFPEHHPGVCQAPQTRLAEQGCPPNNNRLIRTPGLGAEWTGKATAKQLPRTPREGITQRDEN
jgi:hypothetical protein